MAANGRDRVPPLVTVLVTNYNYGRFLRAAVDSALGQTHRPVEVVVVDDGSSDDSWSILDGYGDRITRVRRRNGGQAAAVNAVLPDLAGDLLVLLDADDRLLPDVVERAVAEFAARPGCVRVQYRLRVCDAAGTATGAVVPPLSVPLLQGDLRPLFVRHRGWRWPPTSGSVWSVPALRRLPPVPEAAFRTFVDRWWGDLVPLLGPVAALPAAGGWYRVHGGNHSAHEGHGAHYLRTRVERRRLLHDAGGEVARAAGLAGYPGHPDDLLDPALTSWLLACRKLGIAHSHVPTRDGWRADVHGLRSALLQPGRRPASRLRQAAWYAALLAAPPRSAVARRLVAARYDGDDRS